MTHNSMNCCAVCDVAMEYAGGAAEHKSGICQTCIVSLFQETGDVITTGMRLVQWMKQHPVKVVERVMRNIGFTPCSYRNGVDVTYFEITGR